MATIPTTTYTTVRKVVELLNNYNAVLATGAGGGESVGTGDGSTTVFYLANKKVVQSTEEIYVAGVLKTVVTDYTIDYDAGKITFVSAPSAAAAITANYWYFDLPSSVVGQFIVRAEDEIARRVGRSFKTSQTVTAELYDGDAVLNTSFYTYSFGGDYLDMAYATKPRDEATYLRRMLPLKNYPILTVTALSIDGTAVSSTDYKVYSDPGYLLLTEASGKTFSQGTQNISVSYTYGYSAVPSIVEQLCTKMAATYVIEARLLGDPGQNLDIKRQNLSILTRDIETLVQTLGPKLEATRI